MMYPRLYLARNLLREDGVIFISINDVELPSLRPLMNDVFGEAAFIGALIWKSRHNVDSRNQTGLSSDHEYVLCYGQRLTGQQIDESKYSNPDGDPRGPWMSDNMVGLATREQRPNLHYDLVNPETGLVYPCPEKGWRYDKATMSKKIEEKRVLWPASPEGRPRHKKFLSELRSQFTGFSSLLDVPNTAQGTQELRDIFGETIFDFPKPVGLLRTLVNQATNLESDGICLDFFAGSGTTANAVLDLNKQDGGNRKFILVQLPEPTGRTDYPTIADITKKRVRRVLKKLNDADSGQLPLEGAESQDRGFRVFKLAESNFKPWNADVPHDAPALERQLELHIDHIRDGRTGDDLLYEILLKSGFPLTTPVETLTLAGGTVHSVAGGALFICLERELTLELIRAMADRKPERVVCLDEGFAGNDQLKANAVQIFKTKGVTSFKTV
jgi:Adenine specific DNA methylase Mod